MWRSPQLLLLTAFWIYVTLSDVLYASGMQASLSSMHVDHFFSAPDARLLQHVFLYPLFLGCAWTGLRIGWTPRAVPLQLLLGLMVSAPAPYIIWLAEALIGEPHASDVHPGLPSSDVYSWTASTTSLFCSYGFGLALATGFAFYRRLAGAEVRGAVLERALSAAQLAALRMQLSPHTLFNLLHTIRGHISWDPAQAQAMVVQLGDLLRALLAAGSCELMPLSEEMQFVRLYLGLQQRRFCDRLSVQVPPQEGLPRVWVPSLIMQPLIENAVVHGLAGHGGPVVVRVEALVRDRQLLLRVSNTMGTGPAAGGAGIGLKNVRERLAIQFCSRARLHAGAGVDRVWLAEVRMPLLWDGPAVTPGLCSTPDPVSGAA